MKHKGHKVMSFNEKLVKEGEKPSFIHEGVMYCETCDTEFVPTRKVTKIL